MHDFATAGAHSGGSIIAMTTTTSTGATRIVPRVAHVQVGARLVTHLVTEYGVAHLQGKTARERANSVIGIAHPNHREHLRRAADELLA